MAITKKIGIKYGGTGAATKAAAFDALSPATTQGDLIVRDTNSSIRLGSGSTGQVLTTTAANTLGWTTPNTSYSFRCKSLISNIGMLTGGSAAIIAPDSVSAPQGQFVVDGGAWFGWTVTIDTTSHLYQLLAGTSAETVNANDYVEFELPFLIEQTPGNGSDVKMVTGDSVAFGVKGGTYASNTAPTLNQRITSLSNPAGKAGFIAPSPYLLNSITEPLLAVKNAAIAQSTPGVFSIFFCNLSSAGRPIRVFTNLIAPESNTSSRILYTTIHRGVY